MKTSVVSCLIPIRVSLQQETLLHNTSLHEVFKGYRLADRWLIVWQPTQEQPNMFLEGQHFQWASFSTTKICNAKNLQYSFEVFIPCHDS